MSAAVSRPDHAREVRYALTDPAGVCEQLGLLGGRGTFTRQAGGVIIRCPWHDDRSPSCSVRRGPDGTIAVRCHGCGQTGDVLSLVAVANGLNTRQDFRNVLRAGAEIAGLWGVVDELRGVAPVAERPKPVAPPPEPERTYPPASEVAGLWSAARPVHEDPDAAEMLAARGLDAELVATDDLARALPADASLPWWASYRREPWTKTGHRVIVPMRDATGAIVSVRAWRVGEGESPKRLPPGGHKATALVMACPLALAMIAGTFDARRVVIAEGEPDFLVWATRPTRAPIARLGIVTGSWTDAIASKVPSGAEVFVWTDRDAAGDAYAKTIWQTLRGRCFVRRGGRANG